MNVVRHRSRFGYEETVATLRNAILGAGGTIFAAIDQAAAARGVGLALRPTLLLVFGNPTGGTPLMDAFPLVALELPLKLLVWEAAGATTVAYEPMSSIVQRYGVSGVDERIAAMDKTLDALVSAII
ncbi:MAG TPA: DUF302 domain-containing protein [Candidatus Cybelea sp.]|jgi:uncharacterized protein (DUF302 family)|nr:DUF302 domain-containing protein [Candidatus Cybelea sp.]